MDLRSYAYLFRTVFSTNISWINEDGYVFVKLYRFLAQSDFEQIRVKPTVQSTESLHLRELNSLDVGAAGIGAGHLSRFGILRETVSILLHPRHKCKSFPAPARKHAPRAASGRMGSVFSIPRPQDPPAAAPAAGPPRPPPAAGRETARPGAK